MSAYLDSYSGAGYDGTEDGGIGDTGGGNYVSGLFQNLTTLGTGYLSRRLDIDLYTRAQGAAMLPQLRTVQNGVLISGQAAGLGPNSGPVLNLGNLLPFLLIGGLVYALAK